MSEATRFSHSTDTLQQIAQDILAQALKQGATACETDVSQGFGQSVTVRRSEVETIEYNRDKSLGVTVYIGKKRAHSSTSDFSPKSILDTVNAALSIARYTAIDECSGLADSDLLAKEIFDLDLYHPWDLSIEQAIELAKKCENAAFAVGKNITNSEGANISLQEAEFIYANSYNFMGGCKTSRHGISCTMIAGKDNGMQRDYWYTTARSLSGLQGAEEVGKIAGERSLRRLGARKIPTIQTPVIFEAPIASSLIGHFVSAVSGGSLYRKSSFLMNSLEKQIFSPIVEIAETPHLKQGLASSVFDDEGVATHKRELVKEGILHGYFLGSYSARKLGMKSTGNAGGNHNLILKHGPSDLNKLLKQMGKGLLVTELLGHGVNLVTGDYSRGVAGFWVENGEIQYPVEEITIAGNLKDMYRNISAIGNDVLVHGSKQCGSILIENMTVAGA